MAATITEEQRKRHAQYAQGLAVMHETRGRSTHPSLWAACLRPWDYDKELKRSDWDLKMANHFKHSMFYLRDLCTLEQATSDYYGADIVGRPCSVHIKELEALVECTMRVTHSANWNDTCDNINF